MDWQRIAIVAVLVAAQWLNAEAAHAHELGFGSLDLRVESASLSGELTLDSDPQSQPLNTDARRDLLTKTVRGGLRLSVGTLTLAPELTVLSLGSGEQGVEVLRLRAALPKDATEVELGVAQALGPVAVYFRSVGADEPIQAVLRPGKPRSFPLLAERRTVTPLPSPAAAVVPAKEGDSERAGLPVFNRVLQGVLGLLAVTLSGIAFRRWFRRR